LSGDEVGISTFCGFIQKSYMVFLLIQRNNGEGRITIQILRTLLLNLVV